MQHQPVGCHYEGLIQLSASELLRHRHAALSGVVADDVPDALDKLYRLCVVAVAGLGDTPNVASKIRIAEAELLTAEQATRQQQAEVAIEALRRSQVWLEAALAETGSPRH